MDALGDYVWPRATSELILLPVTGLECVGDRLLAGETWCEACWQVERPSRLGLPGQKDAAVGGPEDGPGDKGVALTGFHTAAHVECVGGVLGLGEGCEFLEVRWGVEGRCGGVARGGVPGRDITARLGCKGLLKRIAKSYL